MLLQIVVSDEHVVARGDETGESAISISNVGIPKQLIDCGTFLLLGFLLLGFWLDCNIHIIVGLIVDERGRFRPLAIDEACETQMCRSYMVFQGSFRDKVFAACIDPAPR